MEVLGCSRATSSGVIIYQDPRIVSQGILTSMMKNLSQGNAFVIVGYPTIHYSAMLRYVPWAIWLGKSLNHE